MESRLFIVGSPLNTLMACLIVLTHTATGKKPIIPAEHYFFLVLMQSLAEGLELPFADGIRSWH
jgi:hypothetical protein